MYKKICDPRALLISANLKEEAYAGGEDNG
jgi:hypothetical protein